MENVKSKVKKKHQKPRSNKFNFNLIFCSFFPRTEAHTNHPAICLHSKCYSSKHSALTQSETNRRSHIICPCRANFSVLSLTCIRTFRKYFFALKRKSVAWHRPPGPGCTVQWRTANIHLSLDSLHSFRIFCSLCPFRITHKMDFVSKYLIRMFQQSTDKYQMRALPPNKQKIVK